MIGSRAVGAGLFGVLRSTGVVHDKQLARAQPLRSISGLVEDVGLLLVLVLMVPLGILVIGMPIVLGLRAATEILRRL